MKLRKIDHLMLSEGWHFNPINLSALRRYIIVYFWYFGPFASVLNEVLVIFYALFTIVNIFLLPNV